MHRLRDKAPVHVGVFLVFSILLELPFAVAEECPGDTPSPTQSSEDLVLRCDLSAAHFGNAASIEAIVLLAGGDYIKSAEGGEFLNATYMDLLIAHPRTFLSVVDEQGAAIKERVIRELNQPVHDAYSASDLLAAVRLAIRQGLDQAFVVGLERSYAESANRERETDKRLRDELETVAEACLDGRSGDNNCSAATAMARENLTVSPHDPVVGAISVDLADFVGISRAGEIFLNEYFMRWACNAAAFYHHAMAQYQRYGARSRDAFDRVCAAQASTPSNR